MFVKNSNSETAVDWTLAIEKNREALRRILAMLVAMVAANGGSAGGQFTSFPHKGSDASGQAQAEKSRLSPALPRHLHRFVLRLLRPAEAAARRLIIIAARGMVVELAPLRPRIAKPKPVLSRRNGFGTGVVIRPGPLPEWARALAPRRSNTLSLPLFDPLKRFGVRRRSVKPSAMPRITSFDSRPFNPLFHRAPQPDPSPLPPSPDDPLDAGRLYRRLEAIGRVLDDLPGQAKRLARWQARRDAALAQESEGGCAEQSKNLPPPLTPPHKGEGDFSAASLSSDPRRRGAGQGAADPPPPCGEGLGVGVSGIRAGRAASAPSKPRFQRFSPIRPGRPPGWRRRPAHAVDEVLNELHGLAVWAQGPADTS